jgi:aminoglycoside phosphotransferase family enzyme
MNPVEINQLMYSLYLQDGDPAPILKETHISWVILTARYAYKVKKPVKLSFLDFSTLAKRKYFCERELFLNKRLAADMYIGVVAIYKSENSFELQGIDGEQVEYALQMKHMDSALEMDKLLQKDLVREPDIVNLARKIATFHSNAVVIHAQPNIAELKSRFNDIASVEKTAEQLLGPAFADTITQAIRMSDTFLDQNEWLLKERALQGNIRDVHGDLHTGNIFLYAEPVVFDCLEFNEELRQMDVLNEVGFLCMDLDAWKRHDLSKLFFDRYAMFSGISNIKSLLPLFNHYKSYCANIRAKVALLNVAKNGEVPLPEEQKQAAVRYLTLLQEYTI